MEVVEGLIEKLLQAGNTFDNDFLNTLEEDEIIVLEEMVDSIEYFIDKGYSYLIVILPILYAYYHRRRFRGGRNLT